MTLSAKHYLACDLGAESGRLMLGTLSDGRLELKEVHRFPNTVLRKGGSLLWDVPSLCREIKASLAKAASLGVKIESISTDSWGLDYVLLDERGDIIAPTHCYRDPRTARGVERAMEKLDWPTIFAETGIQNMPINTLYQLAAESPERLGKARALLGIGDFFNWLLCGRAVAEASLASTYQLYNPVTRNWSSRLIDALELPRHLFPEIVPCGTTLGPLTPELERETDLRGVKVVASCSHDTGAAVAAVPVAADCDRRPSADTHKTPPQPNWAYISSGTWSLMGMELAEPILSDAARELNFTNEIGCGNSVRLLKNIIGLWLVQECRRHWAAQGDTLDYTALTEQAAQAAPFRSLINPADARFLPPGDMPGRMAAYCRETGQAVPETHGQFVRCALESLALLYRRTLKELEQLTGGKLDVLHVVGGGSRNTLLNQFTADACGIPVVAGPTEATSIGNILVQAVALGHVASLAEARDIVRRSFPVEEFTPRNSTAWDGAWERFQSLTN